ncbi:hypothetical protein Acr_00g0086480 [Actinidia rufa]|uniref:Uncharacterized protein n=1 Tax=Actinidia rufa TaxID=165716 RepID=A0A7J0DVR7_9ERIC|nr:hypothetical protein Acr_00g0086480 [Actinidia rufa]
MIMIRKLAKALVRHILYKVEDADHRACTLGEIGVLLFQNLNLQARLTIWMARKPEDIEGHLAEMTKLLNAETSLIPRRSRTLVVGLMPSTPEHVHVANSARSIWKQDGSNGPSTFVQEFDGTLGLLRQGDVQGFFYYFEGIDEVVLEVEGASDKVVVLTMMEGLRSRSLFDSLSKNVLETQSALQSKADKYIAVEELAEAKGQRRGKDDHKRKEPDSRRANSKDEVKGKRSDQDCHALQPGLCESWA